MLLPGIFLIAYFGCSDGLYLPITGLSNVKIQCTNSDPENVKSHFMKEVEKNWDEFWKDSVKYYDEDEFGAKALKENNGLPIGECSVTNNELYIGLMGSGLAPVNRREFANEYNPEFLEKALESTKEKFPDIICSGFIIAVVSYSACDEFYFEEITENGKISYPTEKAYPEIGEVLLEVLSGTNSEIDSDVWWDDISEYSSKYSYSSNGDLKELFECFKVYSDWVKPEYFEKLAEISDDETLTRKIKNYLKTQGG